MAVRGSSRRGYRVPRSFMERATIVLTLVVWAVLFTMLAVRQPRVILQPSASPLVDPSAVPDEVPYEPSEDPSFVTDDIWPDMQTEALEKKIDDLTGSTDSGGPVTQSWKSADSETQETTTASPTTAPPQTAAPEEVKQDPQVQSAAPAPAAEGSTLLDSAQSAVSSEPAAPAAPAVPDVPAAPAAPAVPDAPAPPESTPPGTLSPYTDRSGPEHQKFIPSEKAMFRKLFDWAEKATGTCKRLMKIGGRIQAQGTDCPRLGHKRICLDPPMRVTADDCLVYSFSVLENNWGFDESMAQMGCEVHTFNPRLNAAEGQHSPGVAFHKSGVGRNSHTNVAGWEIMTLDQVMRQMGHIDRSITYLKANAEGSELDMLAQQLLDGSGEFVLDKVQQMGLAVRFRLDPRREIDFYSTASRIMDGLQKVGFRVVHSEYNPLEWQRFWFPGLDRPVSMLYEVLLVKNGADSWDRSTRGQPAAK